ncbi:protein of unknown function (DUF4340) [Abditibacterium utsteinense]|uniref:DUF4340 domain-containing protein n=1 Tax=Abditibacterium utsteinense TaxID=1960156 RepID=A0A2S8SXJ6_9BACT|nr:DUF4340 domain-containing protein [Abditibacterium utsteinense]PQV65525.1 protein of unknown function (DUF4340) [Abditibacterium utsteinense]
MKSLRSTLILLLAALCGGAYLWLAERGPAPRQGAFVLLRATKNEVKSVEFSPSNLKLRREGDSWHIVDEKGKLNAPADPDSTQNLLDALQLVQSDAPVKNPEKLSAYGLEKPRSQIKVDGQTLDFGASPGFDARRVYARTQAGIALVDSQFLNWPQKSFESWRDKIILRFNAEQVVQIVLQTPQTSAVFTKNEENWNIEKPLRARADAATITSALAALQAARTTQWLDENGKNLEKWGLETPRATLSLRGENLGAQLEIGAPQKGGYAARTSASPAIFLLQGSVYALLSRPLKAWRDPRIAVLDANLISRIEVAARGAKRTLLRNGENWRLGGGKNDAEIRGAALDLTEFLGALRAADFVPSTTAQSTKSQSTTAQSTKNEATNHTTTSDARFGLDSPILTLQAETENGETAALVRFGRAQGQLYAQNLGSDSSQAAASTIFVLQTDALTPIESALNKILPQPVGSKPRHSSSHR